MCQQLTDWECLSNLVAAELRRSMRSTLNSSSFSESFHNRSSTKIPIESIYFVHFISFPIKICLHSACKVECIWLTVLRAPLVHMLLVLTFINENTWLGRQSNRLNYSFSHFTNRENKSCWADKNQICVSLENGSWIATGIKNKYIFRENERKSLDQDELWSERDSERWKENAWNVPQALVHSQWTSQTIQTILFKTL